MKIERERETSGQNEEEHSDFFGVKVCSRWGSGGREREKHGAQTVLNDERGRDWLRVRSFRASIPFLNIQTCDIATSGTTCIMHDPHQHSYSWFEHQITLDVSLERKRVISRITSSDSFWLTMRQFNDSCRVLSSDRHQVNKWRVTSGWYHLISQRKTVYWTSTNWL